MINHLSQDQLSMCILGRSTPEERRHGRECPQCRAELARFEAPIEAFRSSMLAWSEREGAAPGIQTLLTVHHRRQSVSTNSFWRWAAAGAAVLLLIAIPIYRNGQALVQRTHTDSETLQLPPIDAPSEENSDVLLMYAVNDHLSRTIPAPMEPIMALIPTQENTQPGGTQ